MASKDYSLVDIQGDEQEIDLQFQDFGSTPTNSAGGSSKNKGQSLYFSEFPDSPDDDQEKLLGDDSEGSMKSSHSFWTFEYYQQFFNVESKQVGDRIIWSMIPKPGINYLQTYIRPNPDLYGPFWICVTLIFTTAVTGNLANYLQTPENYKWRYDFHKVTLATSSIFSYAWLVPIALWGLLLWRGSKVLTLLELICLYGYSLAVFVPVSLLWMIPLKWLQWCLGIVSSVLSGSVLVRTILPTLSHESKRVAIAIAMFILILHAALALGFMLYFFYLPSVPVNSQNKTAHDVAIPKDKVVDDASVIAGNAARMKLPGGIVENKVPKQGHKTDSAEKGGGLAKVLSKEDKGSPEEGGRVLKSTKANDVKDSAVGAVQGEKKNLVRSVNAKEPNMKEENGEKIENSEKNNKPVDNKEQEIKSPKKVVGSKKSIAIDKKETQKQTEDKERKDTKHEETPN